VLSEYRLWQFSEEFRGQLDLLQELNLDESTEELLTAERAFTYVDLYDMLGNEEDTVAWLTPHTSVMRWEMAQSYISLIDGACQYSFIADGKEVFAVAHSIETLSEICDTVLRLLAVSVVHSVNLYESNFSYDTWINPASLSYLMEQCRCRI
jgi:hypothetical protein